MAVRSGLTLQQFLQKEETKPASEYACGEAFPKPMPDVPYSAIQTFLAAILDPFLAQTGSGRAFNPGDTLDGAEVLPGFSVAVDDIFAQMHV